MRKYIVASILTLCLLAAGAATAPAQESASGFEALSLSVEAEKARFALGELVALKIRLTNPTESDVPALRDLDPAYGTIHLYVSRNGDEFRRYLGPGWGTKDPPRGGTQISPGESVNRGITLLSHNKIGGRDDLLGSHVPVDEAGSYQIRVELYDADFRRKIAAPVIDVQVGFPTGHAGESVWQAVRADKKLAYFAQTGDGQLDGRVVAAAEELSRLFPDGEQGKLLALAVGEYHLAQGDAEAAAPYLKQAAESEPASLLRGRALVALAKTHIEKGDVEGALEVSDAAATEYGESEVGKEFERLSSAARQKGGKGRAKQIPR